MSLPAAGSAAVPVFADSGSGEHHKCWDLAGLGDAQLVKHRSGELSLQLNS